MGHRKAMSKRNTDKQTNRQKHRYMDYEKLDLPNPDVRYKYLDQMAIAKTKRSMVREKAERKMIRRIKKM